MLERSYRKIVLTVIDILYLPSQLYSIKNGNKKTYNEKTTFYYSCDFFAAWL